MAFPLLAAAGVANLVGGTSPGGSPVGDALGSLSGAGKQEQSSATSSGQSGPVTVAAPQINSGSTVVFGIVAVAAVLGAAFIYKKGR